MSEKCKEMIFKSWHNYRCSRDAVLDGFCKQHHPDSRKIREEKSEQKYREQLEKSPFRKIEKLTAINKDLYAALEDLCAEFKRCFAIYYYAEPWAHDRNEKFKQAEAALKKARGE